MVYLFYQPLSAGQQSARKKKKTNQISSRLKSCMADGKGMRFQELINLSHDVLGSQKNAMGHGNPSYPTQSYPTQSYPTPEKKGLIKGLVTIGVP